MVPAAILVVVLCVCVGYGVLCHVVVYVSGLAATGATVNAGQDSSAMASSVFSYPAQVVGYDETGEHVTTFNARPDFTLAAFGGYLLGADRGEWGGELMFRDRNGAIHRLVDRNVRGIIRMPFGVVVFTGLAHLSQSAGAIYRVDQRPDGTVSTSVLHVLPGAPGAISWTTRGDLVFEVTMPYLYRRGLFPFRAARTRCLRLDRTGVLQRQLCVAIIDRR